MLYKLNKIINYNTRFNRLKDASGLYSRKNKKPPELE